MKRQRADWDFPYEPVSGFQSTDEPSPLDVVVATRGAVDAGTLREALSAFGPDVRIETLIERAPLYWTRVRSSGPASQPDVAAVLSRAEVAVRYVASAKAGTMALPPALDLSGAHPAGAIDWAALPEQPAPAPPVSGGRWFSGDGGGVRVDRRVCGGGAGTRLAVVDDDAADFEHLELDGIVSVGVERPPAATGHAALMIAWAAGARRPDGTRFVGIAPDASVRAYLTPKAGVDVVSIPLAIARAVFDGADVVVCATYVEGTTSPMLDDALEVAAHLGRGGLGTVVVLPTGRETSSPRGSVHASLSLALGDPASDPRVHCVAPGGREGGWFLWRAPRGQVRPFSNRGPAVRWLAPGDDVAYPFSSRERLFHAESSGASAIAAGVVALVLGCNPALRHGEVHALLLRTVDAPRRNRLGDAALADPSDVLPAGRDRDGHDAKCGYGRLNASRACACARDPFALELVAMGEDEVAFNWCVGTERPYSASLARWAVRRLIARPDLGHAARVILRHARLVAAEPSRARAHSRGALARQLALLVRELGRTKTIPPALREELDRALDGLTRACREGDSVGEMLEVAALNAFERAWMIRPPGPTQPAREAFSGSLIRA